MALAQTEEIARRLKAFGTEVEIVKFETTGDIDQTGKLLPHGGKGGAFVAQIREAVLAGQLHAAMHSLKDMPGNEDTPGLVIGATLSRDPPGDVLVLRPGLSFDEFKRARGKGFKVGTNAVRRAAYARRLFPEVEVIHYRGAADTRVRKLDNLEKQKLPDGGAVGPADALIMARSGLERVGLADRIAYEFPVADMLPAVGQGIVAVECAARDFETRRILSAIDDPAAHACARRRARGAVGAERPLQFADRGICASSGRADVIESIGAGSCRQPHHRGVAHRSRGSPARTRPRGRARAARERRGRHHRAQPAGVDRSAAIWSSFLNHWFTS